MTGINYYAAEYDPTGAVLAAIVILVGFLFIADLMRGSKSYQYRRYLADMFVSSKIRQLADKEDIDLLGEEKAFAIFERKSRRAKDIDQKLQEEMEAKIDKSIEDNSKSTEDKPKKSK